MTQSQALDILKTGANVFLTGEPGAGKTYVINQYVAWLEAAGIHVAVTASTGIAATHIGGMTIHSWSGIGARDGLSPYELDQIASREKLVKRHQKAQVLVIDEISMLDGAVLDMVDSILRATRRSTEAFGGLQVIFVGDFFQLPPVTRQGDMMRYAFESRAWEGCAPLVCYLHEQFRQEDEMLLGLLQAIRKGDIADDHYTLLSEQTDIDYEDIEPTRLYTHNADVDTVNAEKLSQLKGSVRRFSMSGRGSKQLQEALAKNCLSPSVLELKEEAMVMCTKNNFEAGYVNGTLARVVSFANEDGLPVIQTAAGTTIKMKPMSWDIIEDGKVMASVEQLPLRLAWAITVHKSQGMSLDAAEIDLTRAFVFGQGYVALSRVRSLAGLKMLGLGPNALTVDPKVIMQDRRFKLESASARATFENMEASELDTMQRNFIKTLGGKWPDAAAVATAAAGEKKRDRVKAESTYAQTLMLVKAGSSVAAIAKERQLTESTVWGHLEKLLLDAQITEADIEHIVDNENDWEEMKQVVFAVLADMDDEYLKPIFEATGEKYDYGRLRLVRALWQRHNS